jgi:hypothetical protein
MVIKIMAAKKDGFFKRVDSMESEVIEEEVNIVCGSDESSDMECPQTSMSATETLSSTCYDTTSSTSASTSKFKKRWLSSYPWLKYDAARYLMFCLTCQRHRKTKISTLAEQKISSILIFLNISSYLIIERHWRQKAVVLYLVLVVNHPVLV